VPVCARCGEVVVPATVARLVAPGVIKRQFLQLCVRTLLLYAVIAACFAITLWLRLPRHVAQVSFEVIFLVWHAAVCHRFVKNCREVARAFEPREPWWLRRWALWGLCITFALTVLAIILVVIFVVL